MCVLFPFVSTMENVCSGCAPTYLELASEHFKNNEKTIAFFQRHGVLPKELKCPKCNSICTLRTDKHLFRCHHSVRLPHSKKRRPCGFTESQFKGSFLDGARIDPWKVLIFIQMYCDKIYSQSHACKNLYISSRTVVDWRSFCSEVCEHWLNNQDPVGGQGVVVEIDETLVVRRKQDTGRVLKQVWLFGGIERVSKKRFIVPLTDDDSAPLRRNKETLVPLIKKYIRPGTTIYSDSWRAYNSLNVEGYRHWCVNHSINFVDPTDKQIHTQNIERLWRDVKEYIRRPGIRANYMRQYLARYIFLKTHKDQALHHFLLEAAKLYPPFGTRTRPPHPPLTPERGSTDSDISSDLDNPTPSTSNQ